MIAIRSTTTFNGPTNLFTLLRVSRTWQVWKLSFKLFSLYVIYIWMRICLLAHILVSSCQLQHRHSHLCSLPSSAATKMMNRGIELPTATSPLSSLFSSFKRCNQNDEQGKPHREWTTECLSQARLPRRTPYGWQPQVLWVRLTGRPSPTERYVLGFGWFGERFFEMPEQGKVGSKHSAPLAQGKNSSGESTYPGFSFLKITHGG